MAQDDNDLDQPQLQFKLPVLVEQISQILTDAIIDGHFTSGEQLVETKLQQMLGVSRSPLREALRNLEGKGLVEIVPRRGTFVKTITLNDIEEILPVRANLEGLAAKMAHQRMTEEVLGRLRTCIEAMRRAVREKDYKTYSRYHQKFHDIFIDASENSRLIGIITTLRMHILFFRFAHRLHRENLQMMLSRHEKLLEMFGNRELDSRELEEFVRHHIETSGQQFIEYLNDQS